MKQLFPRGKRIRPTDKDLVFHTALAALFPVFLLVILLFHIRQIAGTNWQEVSLSQITQDVNIPYLLFSMGVAGLVCLAAVLLFWRYRRDEVMILSILVDTFFARISMPKQQYPELHNISAA